MPVVPVSALGTSEIGGVLRMADDKVEAGVLGMHRAAELMGVVLAVLWGIPPHF